MRTSFLIGLLVACCTLIAVGPAAADSTVNYPDGSSSLALNLGSGLHAFVFFDTPGDGDIFIHPIDFAANLLQVTLNSTFPAFAIWLDFEGDNGNFRQFGVYTCLSPPNPNFCNVPSVRRGTFFIN